MATRYIHQGPEVPDAVGNASGFAVNENGTLVINRGADFKGALTSDPGDEPVPVSRLIVATSAGVTLTPASHGAVVIADDTTSVIVSLPATVKGLTYTLCVKQLTTSGGHAFSPVAADKILINGKADDADIVCSAATDVLGDFITIIGDGVDGWYVAAQRGTWA